jgi:hypothetical protein
MKDGTPVFEKAQRRAGLRARSTLPTLCSLKPRQPLDVARSFVLIIDTLPASDLQRTLLALSGLSAFAYPRITVLAGSGQHFRRFSVVGLVRTRWALRQC